MDNHQIRILEKLGIDTTQSKEEIFNNVVNLANWLYDCLEEEEEERFARELKRVTQTKTN